MHFLAPTLSVSSRVRRREIRSSRRLAFERIFDLNKLIFYDRTSLPRGFRGGGGGVGRVEAGRGSQHIAILLVRVKVCKFTQPINRSELTLLTFLLTDWRC